MDDKAHRFGLFVVFIIALSAYMFTCCRTVFVGDAGELATALVTGGLAHPPGYPLYTLLGFIWLKLLFFVRPIFAANLLSGLFGASAAAMLYLILERLSGRRRLSTTNAALALVFVFSYPIWSNAVITEVYTLAALLYLIALYAVLKFNDEPSGRHALIMLFWSGLMLAHHFSAAAILIAVVMVFIFNRPAASFFTVKNSIVGAAVFVLPLTLYLFLLWRFDPALPVNWMPAGSLAALWHMVSGNIYQQYSGMPSIFDAGIIIYALFKHLFFSAGPAIILIGLIGLIPGALSDRNKYALIIAPAILTIIMITWYHIPDYDGYLSPLLVGAVIGLHHILLRVYDRRAAGAESFVSTLAIVVMVLAYVWNVSVCNLSGTDIGERYGKDMLDCAPSHSTVFLQSDNAAHPALYLRYIEGYRPDVAVFSTNSTMTRLLADHKTTRFEETVGRLERDSVVGWGKEYIINQGANPSASPKISAGLLYIVDRGQTLSRLSFGLRVGRKEYETVGEKSDLKLQQVYLEYALNDIDTKLSAGDPSASESATRLREIAEPVDDPLTNLAIAQFYRIRNMSDESLYWIFKCLRSSQPSFIARDIFVNLGMVYRQQGNMDEANNALQKALENDPDYGPARYNSFLIESELALRNQDFAKSIDIFDSLLAIEPDNPLLYFNKAVIFDKMDGYDKDAWSCYQKTLSLGGYALPPQVISKVQKRLKELEALRNSE